MQREIKFRGKSIHTREWLYGDLLIPKNRDNGYYIRFDDAEGSTLCWEVDPETVGQYTDRKDKNSVDIYEGDILAVKFNGAYIERIHWKGPADAIAEVYWDYSGFRLNCHGYKDRRYADFHDFLDEREWEDDHGLVMISLKHTKVIGNIYENRNLLESNNA